jgi:hypothetical protein
MPGANTSARPSPDDLLIQQTFSSIQSTPCLFRLASGAVLFAAGIATLVLGASLLHSDMRGASPAVFLLLEPAGIFLICIALVALAPQSSALRWFRGAYFRLRIVLFVLALAAGVGALLFIGSLLIELLRQ